MSDSKPISIKTTNPEFPEIDGFSKEELQHFHEFMFKNYPDGTIRYFPSGHYTLCHSLIYHWTVKRGAICDYNGYDDRYCFATEQLALEAINAWNDPTQECPGHWRRHPKTGRRREWNRDGTFLEYVMF
ncbi:hypothetical protein [Acetobacter pasteurianus]|uniref:hypothetical protein n=1 Tax=Acetobacter pasteurianus TaxID=438 RepID=UPI000F553991|nr:hypothetical protein [Acetobacter pasteurianus]